MKISIIGAGLFGMSIAIKLSEKYDVTIFEKNKDVMLEASMCNHNRVHFGYHYPRSIETSKQSLEGYNLFYENFKDSIYSNFPNYYMIEKNSKISSDDYIKFCQYLKLSIKDEFPNININKDNIVSSFLTNEPIFDFNSIKKTILNKSKNINIFFNTKITDKNQLEDFDVVINTSYSDLNNIKNIFNIPNNKLRFQDVVIPVFEFEHPKIGLTIMDGEFCSILPNGNKLNSFLLYNVKYSVLNQNEGFAYEYDINYKLENEIDEIYNMSKNYFNFLDESKHVDYLRTIRTIPINDDDGRMSVFDINIVDNKKIISVLSGKITTCCDIAEQISKII